MMNAILNHAGRFMKSQDGVVATEYAVMLALVIVALIPTITAFRQKIENVFIRVGNAVAQTT